MDHKKISLDPEELNRLKTLLKEEEAKIDELSDSELEAAELALAKRIKKLAEKAPETKADDSMNANWQKIQERMASSASTSSPASPILAQSRGENEGKENVVAFAKKKKSTPWTALGIFAAAALALFVLFPMIHNESQSPGDLGVMQTKGVGSTSGMTSFCDIDIRGKTPSSVEEAGDGTSFIATPDEPFQLNFLCDHAGYIQLWSIGDGATEIRNFQVNAKERLGKDSEFVLRDNKTMTFGIVLTDKPIANDVDLLNTPMPATALGTSKLLWSDSITVKGKSQ